MTEVVNDRKRMKNLHRKEGAGVSFKVFLHSWAAKMVDINNRPMVPNANDSSYAACAWRILHAD